MSDHPPVPTFLEELPLARRALDYARERHRGQRRDSDAAPFILHPLEVASLLHNTGHGDVVVAAGVLHDTVEDTDAELSDVAGCFGDEVGRLVAAMTEDPAIEPYEARKAGLRRQIARFGPDATAVYAADKVAKVRELRAQVSHDPVVVNDEERYGRRLAHYQESLAMLEAETPQHPLVRQLRFELEALAALPPRARTGPG
jgi:(p)ppGpp synthase/HD superfamily hydrolase